MRGSISAQGIWKGFSTLTGDLPVIDGIDLSVASGEFVALIGPSGCGKSTLLDILAGFQRPDRGEVRIDDQALSGPDPKRILIPQRACVFPWMSARRNLHFVQNKASDAEKSRLTQHYLQLVGLEEFEHAYPYELSGGMLKRLEIARALVVKPDILLMDEPFGSLDALTRLKLRTELRRLLTVERHTVLLVTHDVDDALHLADRIVIMTPRPATVKRVVEVPFPHPRALASSELTTLKNEILTDLGIDTSDVVEAPRVASSKRSVVTKRSVGAAQLDADVIVIGGGPAGAILGSYLGQAGVDHIVLDKAVHPRPHVGESLICSTTRVFNDIGFLPVMEREGFVRKHGAVWNNWADASTHVLRFQPIPHLGVLQDYAYHVDRSRFDTLLLDHARGRGSRVLEHARAMSVEFGPDGFARGVRVRSGNGDSERLMSCRIVVDASGRNAVLGSQLKLKRMDAMFDQFAIHSWFEGVNRGPAETADYIQIYTLPTPHSWIWQIPISPDITSLGIVAPREDFVSGHDEPEQFFARHVAAHPALARRMAASRPLHAFTREGNYSYVMDRFVGDGWLLLGDAARFVDPIFSSGISVAAESARLAAAAVTVSLQSGDTGADAFAEYEQTLRSGLDVWRKFIVSFYQLPPLFLDLLDQVEGQAGLRQILQGEVYGVPSVPILDRIDQRIEAVKTDPQHPWRNELTSLARGSADVM